ncbi:MAG: hypothetical protein JO047_15720, partial [Alphaproteobacteria bacterium]|nr:hypothetical protein [Alphaproteobacteria bacterium]
PDLARSQRTEWNVCCSDASLIFCPAEAASDPGTAWTRAAAELLARPCKVIDDPARPGAAAEVVAWLDQCAPPVRWLNVAGPSRRTLETQIGAERCRAFLAAVGAVLRSVYRFGPGETAG